MKKRITAVIVIITFIIILSLFWISIPNFNVVTPSNDDRKLMPYIMLNQVGYFEDDLKLVIIRTDSDLYGMTIRAINLNTSESFEFKINEDLGEGYGFKHHFLINITSINKPGMYYLEVDNVKSPTFLVASGIYNNVFNAALDFFQLNRCGKSRFHNECHTDDGIIANGPHKGLYVNASGGWHDAGDYIKFTSTTAETMLLLMENILINGLTKDTLVNFSKLINEITWGLDWLKHVWINDWRELIFMVGNRSDHFQGFRMPEDDPLHDRPVYVCEAGKGANVAGVVSSVFSLASILSSKGFLNQEMADEYLNLAIELYDFGKEHKGVQEIGLNDWIAYPDYGWQDDMALAGVLLYKLTGDQKYYNESITFFREYSEISDVPYTVCNLLAAYHLNEVGYNSSFENIYYDLSWNFELLKNDPLFFPWPKYYWGSVPTFIMLFFAEYLYRLSTEHREFYVISTHARDYTFGRNQWGICFVTGFGNSSPLHLDHQILYLTNSVLPGILVEGGVSKDLIQEYNIDVLPPSEDPYAIFQSDEAFYQDVHWNYLTNEPTIRSQALFLFMLGTLI